MKEHFRPVKNAAPSSHLGKLIFYGRMLLDFQILTIFRDLKKSVPAFRGKVLDVGCGQSPYRSLLDENTTDYYGIDIAEAEKFDYANKDITRFDGRHIPFEDNKFDCLLCTEVLEHVFDYQGLVNEMRRVLRTGGVAIITIPWSARQHYVPHDFFRYTRFSLENIFAEFGQVEIRPRGTDVAVIANKLLVLWVRNLLPREKWNILVLPLWLLFSPIPMAAVLVAHLCILFDLGGHDDPLGFTITVTK